MIKHQAAYEAGRRFGHEWIGPFGDRSFGVLSADFVREQAEQYACCFTFRELLDGPTAEEVEKASDWMLGCRHGMADVSNGGSRETRVWDSSRPPTGRWETWGKD